MRERGRKNEREREGREKESVRESDTDTASPHSSTVRNMSCCTDVVYFRERERRQRETK